MHRPYQPVLLLGDVGFGVVDVLKALTATLPPLGARSHATGTMRTLAYPSSTKRYTFFEPFERFTPIEHGVLREVAIDVAVVVAWTIGDVERLARQLRAARAVDVASWVIFIETSRGTPAGHDQLERQLRQLLVEHGIAGDDVDVVRGAIGPDVVTRLIDVLDAVPVAPALQNPRRRDVEWA